MKIIIGNEDILPVGEYELTDPSKLARAKQALSANPSDREIFLEYDKIAGRVVNTSTRQTMPHQTFWNIQNKHSDRPIERYSDAELLAVIRKAENTNVPGSRYQKANNEWQIRYQQATLKAMEENGKPSFVKIASGAIVAGLTMKGNTMVGDGNFLRNEGKLEDANLENNQHILPVIKSNENSKKWYEKPIGIIVLGVLIAVIAAGIIFKIGWN